MPLRIMYVTTDLDTGSTFPLLSNTELTAWDIYL